MIDNCFRFHSEIESIPKDVKAHLVVRMISELVDKELFDSDQLLKFALTVCKNYRKEPYHNWDHAFHVAHCMYCILKEAKDKFTTVEVRF